MNPVLLRRLPLMVVCLVAVFTARAGEIPTARQILDGVLERSEQQSNPEAAFKARYAFSRDRLLEVRDGSGKLKKHEAKVLEHTPKSQATNELVTTAEGHRPAADADEKKRAYERRDFKLDRELLARFHFDLAGEETMAGRQVWLLDFRPADNAPSPHGMKERFMSLLAGRVWVDAADHEVVRLEFHLTGSVNVVGGLAGAVKACRATLERDRTGEGLWFTRQMTWHLEGRQFLSHRVMDFTEEVQNVRLAAP